MNTEVILGKQGKKFVLLDVITDKKWANEYFETAEDAQEFCEQNKLEYIDLFENYERLPEPVQELLLVYGELEGYEECRELVADLENLGYTADYGLSAEVYDLAKIVKP